MTGRASILIAGAGIGGLTAALAFAGHGFDVEVFERSERPEPGGAGLQLSPNATRLLKRLGVVERLKLGAVRPEAIVLKSARKDSEIARIPLGESAEARWGAPYLTARRADLQAALADTVATRRNIRVSHGICLGPADILVGDDGVELGLGRVPAAKGLLLVGADGVRSAVRASVRAHPESRFTGSLAWRASIAAPADGLLGEGLPIVTAFLHPGAHCVAYPVDAGRMINLVAIAPGGSGEVSWNQEGETATLLKAFYGAAQPLLDLIERAGPWTLWPVHDVDPGGPWIRNGRIALIGDAAHAMTPFAAQGAAMAIEDAATLADAVASHPSPADIAAVLAHWERERRARILRVARRGALNRFGWHAAGPAALARDVFLRLRSSEQLAADLDWLYGWDTLAAS